MVDIVPGQVVAGWRVQRELARGGMGVLFLAEHPRLPRVDVLKVLPAWLAQDERFRERFLREGRRVSALAHPHVVVVHDSGEHEGMLYLAMQYISGGDLRAQLADRPMPVDRALHLGRQIASALDAAHRAGIVHRDVKPENVLLFERGPFDPEHAVLTDFGISRETEQASTLTATGELLLTPAYAAPEQISATTVDGRADQYALGCMIFEMLTGKPPYAGGSQVSMLAAHLYDDVRGLPPEFGVPDGVEHALRRAMAKKPDDRFPSCQAFLDEALMAVRGTTARASNESAVASTQPAPGQPVRPVPPKQPEAFPPHAPSPTRKRRRRIPRVVLALVTVATVGGLAAVVALRSGADPTASNSVDPVAGTYAALVQRVPEVLRAGCEDHTSELTVDQQRYVSARARCSGALRETAQDGGATDQRVEVVYDAIKGDAGVATTYRRNVLGIGSSNHAPGDCRTRLRDPRYLDRPARRGLYMPPGPAPLDVETWCDFAGPVYLLAPDETSAIFLQLTRVGDDGDIALQQRRYDDLTQARPV